MRGTRGVGRSGSGGMKAFGIGASTGASSLGAGSNNDGFVGIGRIETSVVPLGDRMAAATAAWAADSIAAPAATGAAAGLATGGSMRSALRRVSLCSLLARCS